MWQLREGPSQNDPPCISYLYFSSSDPVIDTNSGLIGPLLVCKKDALDSKGAQVKYDWVLDWPMKRDIQNN